MEVEVYFAYFDESGDSGVGSGSPTRFFVLACVLVPALSWESTLNRLIDLRRWLRDEYGVPVRPELKALDFVKGRGGFTGSRVDRRERLAVYAQCLRRVAAIPDVKVFAGRHRETGRFGSGLGATHSCLDFRVAACRSFLSQQRRSGRHLPR